jgi:hypothetical protein
MKFTLHANLGPIQVGSAWVAKQAEQKNVKLQLTNILLSQVPIKPAPRV